MCLKRHGVYTQSCRKSRFLYAPSLLGGVFTQYLARALQHLQTLQYTAHYPTPITQYKLVQKYHNESKDVGSNISSVICVGFLLLESLVVGLPF